MIDVNRETLEKQTKLADTLDRLIASKNVSQWAPKIKPTASNVNAVRRSNARLRLAILNTKNRAKRATSKRYQTRA